MCHNQDSVQPNRLKKRRSLPKFTQIASHRKGVKPWSSRPSHPHPQCCVTVCDWWDITTPQDVRGAGPRSDLVQPPPLNWDEGTGTPREDRTGICVSCWWRPFQAGLCSPPSSPRLCHRSLPVPSHCWDLGTAVPAGPTAMARRPSARVPPSLGLWPPAPHMQRCWEQCPHPD